MKPSDDQTENPDGDRKADTDVAQKHDQLEISSVQHEAVEASIHSDDGKNCKMESNSENSEKCFPNASVSGERSDIKYTNDKVLEEKTFLYHGTVWPLIKLADDATENQCSVKKDVASSTELEHTENVQAASDDFYVNVYGDGKTKSSTNPMLSKQRLADAPVKYSSDDILIRKSFQSIKNDEANWAIESVSKFERGTSVSSEKGDIKCSNENFLEEKIFLYHESSYSFKKTMEKEAEITETEPLTSWDCKLETNTVNEDKIFLSGPENEDLQRGGLQCEEVAAQRNIFEVSTEDCIFEKRSGEKNFQNKNLSCQLDIGTENVGNVHENVGDVHENVGDVHEMKLVANSTSYQSFKDSRMTAECVCNLSECLCTATNQGMSYKTRETSGSLNKQESKCNSMFSFEEVSIKEEEIKRKLFNEVFLIECSVLMERIPDKYLDSELNVCPSFIEELCCSTNRKLIDSKQHNVDQLSIYGNQTNDETAWVSGDKYLSKSRPKHETTTFAVKNCIVLLEKMPEDFFGCAQTSDNQTHSTGSLKSLTDSNCKQTKGIVLSNKQYIVPDTAVQVVPLSTKYSSKDEEKQKGLVLDRSAVKMEKDASLESSTLYDTLKVKPLNKKSRLRADISVRRARQKAGMKQSREKIKKFHTSTSDTETIMDELDSDSDGNDTDVTSMQSSTTRPWSTLKELVSSNEYDDYQERPFQCGKCEKSFKTLGVLREHSTVHQKARPFRCKECKKTYRSNRDLKKHYLTHTKPYKCDTCGKACSTSSSLREHNLVHTTEKPHTCDECGKKFKNLGQKRKHLRIHTKPFKCNDCGQAFSHPSDVVNHSKVHGAELPHQCLICHKSFALPSQLREHDKTHSEKGRFKCDICGKSFSCIASIKCHLAAHSKEMQFQCKTCGKWFTHKNILYQHTRHVHSGVRPYACEICKKDFPTKAALRSHKYVHSNERPYKCKHCEYSGKSVLMLKSHNETHTKPHQCKECGKRFTRSRGLLNHHTVHGLELPHACHMCNKMYATASLLRKHMTIHSQVRSFQCKLCGKAFKTKEGLQQHSYVHTGEKPYHCKDCGKGFTQMSNLRTHSRVHTEEKPYKCDDCGKCFRHSTTLVKHKGIHTGEKPMSCYDCGMKYRTLSGLTEHIRKVHTQEHVIVKKLKCTVCDKELTRKDSLRSHMLIHTKEKPLKCNYCEKRFRVRTSLTHHLRIHTGETPYKCKYCGKGLKQHAHLVAHLRTHTGERPYECKTCGKRFMYSYSFKQHTRIHSGEKS